MFHKGPGVANPIVDYCIPPEEFKQIKRIIKITESTIPTRGAVANTKIEEERLFKIEKIANIHVSL